jgi:hypothetical protein
MDRLTVRSRPHARLYDEGHTLPAYLPSLVVRKPAMGEGGLAPTREQIPNASVLISQVRGRGFDLASIEPVEEQGALLPCLFYCLMNTPHGAGTCRG